MDYIDGNESMLSYELPLADIVIDFYDKLKSRTKGYASFEYELSEYRASNLVKVDILVSGNVSGMPSHLYSTDHAYSKRVEQSVKN